MSWNETIDNYLYDEENEYTQADDLWDDFFVEKRDEIDERPWNQADALAHRNELNKQVGDMLERVLPEEERELFAPLLRHWSSSALHGRVERTL